MAVKRQRGRPYKDGLPDEIPNPERYQPEINADLLAGTFEMYEEYINTLRLKEHAIICDRLLIDREEAWQCSPDAQLRIEAEYNERVAQSKAGAHSGATATAKAAQDRAYAICKKNQDLINRIKPKGRHTVNSVAQIIHAEWLLRAPKLTDYKESDSYKDDLSAAPPPSVRTLRAYIKIFLLLKQ